MKKRRSRAGFILRKIKGLSDKEAKKIIDLELALKFDEGYSEGHEYQMQMRIRDAQERALKETYRVFK